jgi:hypothetical protein
MQMHYFVSAVPWSKSKVTTVAKVKLKVPAPTLCTLTFIYIISNNSVPNLQEARYITTTRAMRFKPINAAYKENHTKNINTLCVYNVVLKCGRVTLYSEQPQSFF